jgi:hypothetical protein
MRLRSSCRCIFIPHATYRTATKHAHVCTSHYASSMCQRLHVCVCMAARLDWATKDRWYQKLKDEGLPVAWPSEVRSWDAVRFAVGWNFTPDVLAKVRCGRLHGAPKLFQAEQVTGCTARAAGAGLSSALRPAPHVAPAWHSALCPFSPSGRLSASSCRCPPSAPSCQWARV